MEIESGLVEINFQPMEIKSWSMEINFQSVEMAVRSMEMESCLMARLSQFRQNAIGQTNTAIR
jgi:hypothetical protein